MSQAANRTSWREEGKVDDEIPPCCYPDTEEVESRDAADFDHVAVKLMICGGIAGAFAKSCTAPLARLTILYQVQAFDKPTTGACPQSQPKLFQALKLVIKHEGVLSLWKGNGVTILHRLPYSAINFCTYELTSAWLDQHHRSTPDFLRRLTAGGVAGLAACTAAYPLDLVRTRLAAQTKEQYYRGVVPTVSKIIADEGMKGLYHGLGATLVQVVPSLAINFCLYESMKAQILQRRGRKALNTASSLTCGCISGFTASTLTFPLDVVRRRMQVYSRGQSTASNGSTAPLTYGSVIRGIVKQHGLRGFYHGIVPEYCKVIPGVAIAFGTYEHLKRVLHIV